MHLCVIRYCFEYHRMPQREESNYKSGIADVDTEGDG